MGKPNTSLRAWRDSALAHFQLRLSRADAVMELSLLGLLSGVIAGVISILFRLAVEFTQGSYLSGPPGSFETLGLASRFWLPVAGGLLIGVLLQFVRQEQRMVGVLHVMQRLQYHQGRMPLANALVQFVGGLLALASGHSVGREGPGVHLGVAASNLPAQALGLPNNSLRVLAACGTAAAIAASFNTPLAGVVFAMEVLMFQYTMAAFAPVLLAAVSATALSRLVFGNDLAFSVPDIAPGSLSELPLVLLMGILTGVLAGIFIRLLRETSRRAEPLPLWWRGLLAGLLIGTIGLFVPEVMGIGYDTVNRLIQGEMALWLIFAIVLLKLLASTTAVGLGIPGGLIGPALVVGAASGGAFAWVTQQWGLAEDSSTAVYVLLGMGAMMAGTLQAPLAALIAILELTGNPGIIFPGMLAVIAATLTSGQVHGRESMYLAMLRATGKDYRNDPIAESLRKLGVGAVMEHSFVSLPRRIDKGELEASLSETPRWILLHETDEPPQLLAAVDIAIAIKEKVEGESLDLMSLPAKRLQAAPIDFQCTLQDARELLTQSGAEALYVTRLTVPGISRVYGVLTREDIESSYRF
ncbi:MAG: chloride channel protein [Gammaproteobacteria bacterium]|nr:chloride channel protein [Gammaproteobacteria bacterium]MCW8840544.1 chloride channel protein [Gammaproteobacteria bacterium]MCW8927949.1 chloride channel protein [Gammaproteobacteria bacterium]MCW8959066.1 chloride channel protein [Gammaproteobacteria bacterium]MCW8972084.1 chloride channel protein [Gammaproteobacteria bacterium]